MVLTFLYISSFLSVLFFCCLSLFLHLKKIFFVGTGSARVLFPCILLHWWVHFPRPVLLYPANTVKSESQCNQQAFATKSGIMTGKGTLLLTHNLVWSWKPFLSLLGDSGGVVNSLDFCPASLKSLGCFYFQCVFLHNGRRRQWICKFFTANFKGIFGGP